MRQLFFAVVLVAAAFGGGAMVNGPGFRWVQDHLSDYMGLKDGGEIASIDLPPAPTDDAPLDASPTSSAGKAAGEARPAPEPRPAEPVAAEPRSQPAPQPDADPTPTTPPPPLLAGPSGAPGPAPSAPPAPLDPGVAPALLASLSPVPSPSPSQAATPGGLPPDLAPAPAAEVKPASAPTPTSGGGDWGELRRKLKEQGVTRFTVEADVQGRALFSCLIPLAGKQAVSQQFEAEGDDEFEAATAALRRIKLWRAAQAPAPASP